jgi:hypothetical protein
MSVQRLESDGAGRAILVKTAGAGPDAERLRREAVLLRAASHPGVVELLYERDADDGGVQLVLAVAGARTLADVRTDLRGVADLVAALATTVADLHDLGFVHGRITPDHVVVDATGRPVLCGLAESGPAIEGRRPADDVAALGVLLAGLAEPVHAGPDTQWEPIPERRFVRADRWNGYAKRALLTVVDQATAEDPGRRPSARAFAAAVLAARPEPRRAPLADRDVGAIVRRAATPVAAAVGLGLLVFGVGSLLRPAPATNPDPVAAAGAAPAPTSATTGPSSASTGASTTESTSPDTAGGLRPLDCAPIDGPAADPDGDGCPSPAQVGDGVVEVDGVRYGVGRPGDLLAVGDWDCDGSATVALVHAGTGEVFVFDGWASGTTAEETASGATVPGAAELVSVDDDGDGCPALVVVDDHGDRTEVPA